MAIRAGGAGANARRLADQATFRHRQDPSDYCTHPPERLVHPDSIPFLPPTPDIAQVYSNVVAPRWDTYFSRSLLEYLN